MAIDVVLESESEDMEFATVNRWHKQEGEPVARSEALVEVEAEKASYDVAAPAEGVLASILAMPGDEVAVGGLLGTIEPAS